MLKVSNITFQDSIGRELFVSGKHIEFFPFIGGEEANIITTRAWNQQGNTHLAAYMESFEGEIVFIIPSLFMNDEQVQEKRNSIVDICNPLNGTITMKIVLSNEQTFNRDITFIAAPAFPIGPENRNKDWQKVILFYEANNPFWYEEESIVESFQAVEPLFTFPFSMSAVDPVVFGNVIPSKIATNEGQVEAPVTIKIVGACVNPLIENRTTGEVIKFKNLTMGAQDELLIDTAFGQKKIELNGQNAFNTLDFAASTFFSLQIGDNEIEFTDETASNNATIHFIYRNLYITI
jgi:hypothetical protein